MERTINLHDFCLECAIIWKRNLDFECSRHKKNKSIRDVDLAQNDEDKLDENENEQGSFKLVQKPRQIIKIVETRKIKFSGHVMSHNTFIINIMEGKINGKRDRGRPRDTNIGNTMKLLSLPSEAMKRLAGKREEWLQRQGEAFR
ncbi:Hypothetical protein CINCED_3A005768 [Cinara cedri]|nr:Hypothetical protein CINCED_3A005768 [Cinara cedri]